MPGGAPDPRHHAFEDSGEDFEVGGAHVGQKEPLQAIEMDLVGRAILCPSPLGEGGEDPASVARTRASLDEPEPFETGHDARHPSTGKDGLKGDVGHPLFPSRPGEVQEDLELAQAEVAVGAQIGVELSGDEGMAAQEATPGRAFDGGQDSLRGRGSHGRGA